MLADDQARPDLAVGKAIPREPRDLRLLRGEIVTGVHAAFPDAFAGRQQLSLGPPGEPLGAHAREHLQRAAQLPAGVDAAWAPARKAAALDWAGLHALRHTCASLLIDEGRSPVQIAAWLGHHSPAFSMAVYGHLMDDGVGEDLHLTPPVVAA